MNGSLNEVGFVKNILTNIGLGDGSNSIIELIDNSIDANATSINISIKKIELQFICKRKKIIEDQYYLIVSDDGSGLDYDKTKKLLTLCEPNKDNNKNGKFGVGASASFITLNKDLINNKIPSYVLVLSDTDSDVDKQEIIFDFTEINKDNFTWSNYSSENMSNINKKIYDDYKIENKNSGTVIISTISENDVSKLIDELKYKCNLHYYNFIKQGITINFTSDIKFKDENDKDISWILNHDNIIDLTGKESDNNQYIFKIYKGAESFYAIPKKKIKNKDKHINTNNKVIKLKKYNKNQWCTELDFIDKISEEINFNDYIEFRLIVVPCKNNITIKNFLGLNSLQGTDYNGLYIERNNRIITKPIQISKRIRQTQSGSKYRAILAYSGGEFDKMFPLQVNKSQFNATAINKGLKRLVEILADKIFAYYNLDKDNFNQPFFDSENKEINLISQTLKSSKSKTTNENLSKSKSTNENLSKSKTTNENSSKSKTTNKNLSKSNTTNENLSKSNTTKDNSLKTETDIKINNFTTDLNIKIKNQNDIDAINNLFRNIKKTASKINNVTDREKYIDLILAKIQKNMLNLNKNQICFI